MMKAGDPTKYKSQKELAEENPSGMDILKPCHNFSSNPGFMSTAGMLGASQPANGDGVIRGTLARGSLPNQGGGPAARTNPATGPVQRPTTFGGFQSR